MDTYKALASDC